MYTGVAAFCGRNILFQLGEHRVKALFAIRAPLLVVQDHRFGQLSADAHDGVEGGQGVLEYHREPVTAQGVEFLFGDFQQVAAVIDNFAAFDHGVAREDAHDRACGNGFAGATLAGNGQRFTRVQIEGNIAHRAHRAVIGAERDRQISYFELRHQSPTPLSEGLNASLRPLPNRLNEISNSMMCGKVLRYRCPLDSIVPMEVR